MSPLGRILDLEIKNVVFVGAGFVGGPTAAVLASFVEDINVTVVDINESRIEAWNSDELPVSEPGLIEILADHRIDEDKRENVDHYEPVVEPNGHVPRRRNLCFSSNVDAFLRQADLIFLCVDTPQKVESELYESAPDLTNLKKAIRRIGELAEKDFILVEKCTVPAGTAKVAEEILKETLRPDIQFEILSNPEFLAEGCAIQDLEEPDRVLIGSGKTPEGFHAARLLARLYGSWVPRERIMTSDTWSSELAKLAANALLSQRISSINSFSMICEQLGADVREVSKVVQLDPRIGSRMLSASIGFGGSCFQKDVAHLVYLANSLDLPEVAQYWKSVLQINHLQKQNFAHRVIAKLDANRPGEVLDVAILGFAFKAETNDARNSPAIDIVKKLMTRHNVRIYDPCVPKHAILASLGLSSSSNSKRPSGTSTPTTTTSAPKTTVTVHSSAYEACSTASAVGILTEWREFRFVGSNRSVLTPLQSRPNSAGSHSGQSWDSGIGCSPDRAATATTTTTAATTATSTSPSRRRTSVSPPLALSLDWDVIAKNMTEPRYLFDGRNIVDDSIESHGFTVFRIGKMDPASENVPGKVD